MAQRVETTFGCAKAALPPPVPAVIVQRMIAPVAADGSVCFYSLVPTDIVVDVGGLYRDGSRASGGGMFSALTPARILDTRNGTGGYSSPVGPGGSIAVAVTGVGGVPATGVSASSARTHHTSR